MQIALWQLPEQRKYNLCALPSGTGARPIETESWVKLCRHRDFESAVTLGYDFFSAVKPREGIYFAHGPLWAHGAQWLPRCPWAPYGAHNAPGYPWSPWGSVGPGVHAANGNHGPLGNRGTDGNPWGPCGPRGTIVPMVHHGAQGQGNGGKTEQCNGGKT